MTSNAVMASLQARGLPPYVDPCVPGTRVPITSSSASTAEICELERELVIGVLWGVVQKHTFPQKEEHHGLGKIHIGHASCTLMGGSLSSYFKFMTHLKRLPPISVHEYSEVS